jgi:hypothetical protein
MGPGELYCRDSNPIADPTVKATGTIEKNPRARSAHADVTPVVSNAAAAVGRRKANNAKTPGFILVAPSNLGDDPRELAVCIATGMPAERAFKSDEMA